VLYTCEESKEKDPYFVLDNEGQWTLPFTCVCEELNTSPLGNLRQGFSPVQAIEIDMERMEKTMKARWSLTGRSWRLQYQVVLRFTGSECRAFVP
jgi:hypothetical protein